MIRKTLAAAVAAISLAIVASPAAAGTYGGIRYEAQKPWSTNGNIFGWSEWGGGTATVTGYMTTHLMRKDGSGNWYAFRTKQVTLLRGVTYAWTTHDLSYACSIGGAYPSRIQARFASGAWDLSSAPTLTCRW